MASPTAGAPSAISVQRRHMTSPTTISRVLRRLAVVTVAGAMVVAAAGTAPSFAATGYLGTLNSERVSHGLNPLRTSAALTEVAQAWARQMAATHWLRHNPRLQDQVGNWRELGENVGDGKTMSSLAQAFWQSAEHRANILDPQFRQVGIGHVRRDGLIWIAVVFRAPMRSGGTATTTAASPAPRASSRDGRAWPGRLLTLGSSGPAVAYVQRLLGLRADGLFGAHTRRAVVDFQRRHHLSADGIVGPITWSALTRMAARTT
jgi:uncharacterized protein YkwD